MMHDDAECPRSRAGKEEMKSSGYIFGVSDEPYHYRCSSLGYCKITICPVCSNISFREIQMAMDTIMRITVSQADS